MLQNPKRASEVKVEQTTGLPMLTVNIDRLEGCSLWIECGGHPGNGGYGHRRKKPAHCSKVIDASTSWCGYPVPA